MRTEPFQTSQPPGVARHADDATLVANVICRTHFATARGEARAGLPLDKPSCHPYGVRDHNISHLNVRRVNIR
jgi:hypothetical protein